MDHELLILGDGETHEPSRNVVLMVLTILFRRRRVMLIAFIAVMLGFVVAKFMHHPMYRSTMTILVNGSRVDTAITSSSTESLRRDALDDNQINSEVQLLKSHDLLTNVVKGLNLQQSGKGDEHTLTEGAVNQLSSALVAEPVKKTNLISVSFTSGDRDFSSKVLNLLSELYLQKHADVRRPRGELEFFKQQTDEHQKALAKAEAELSAFAQESGTSAPQTERDQVLGNLKDANATLQQTNASIKETEKRLLTLKRQAGSTPSRQTTQLRTSDNSLLMQQLRSTLLALELKRTNLLQTYQPDYPLVVEVEKQIEQTKTALDGAGKNPIREETTDRDPTFQWIAGERVKAEADLDALRAKSAATASTIREYQSTARDLNQKSIQQADLLRNVKTNEDNYLLYKRKMEEARLSEALDARGILNVVVADPPTRPVFPESSPMLNPIVGLFVAMLGSIAMAFIVEYMDPSVKSPSELQRVLQLPVLAALPAHVEIMPSPAGSLHDIRSSR